MRQHFPSLFVADFQEDFPKFCPLGKRGSDEENIKFRILFPINHELTEAGKVRHENFDIHEHPFLVVQILSSGSV